ncbi:MAG: DUF222 domain-containing protein [Ancrocorticia populi]|uniref:HNH endonuclease signature motif containing protein n=1 Tax=Ancrocorticia populi TaxID=2175228 RepID=UPI003F910CCA
MATRTDWATVSEEIGELSGQVAQLHAQIVSLAARVIEDDTWKGGGIRSVEHFLTLKTGLDRHTVGKMVKVARRTGELPELMASLTEGRVTLDQAAIVAAHAPASYSADATEIAQYATCTQLRRALSTYFRSDHSTPDTGRDTSSLTMGVIDDQFRLSFTTTDLVAGSQVQQAIREAKDALFTAGNTEASLADGLVDVAARSLETVTEPSRRNRYQVLIHLDTDGKSWLHKAGALPHHLTERYTCEGQLIPVWETEGKPVAVGRTQRIVPGRTRRLVEDRDKGCRFPDCASTGYLEIHHKTHWRDGGSTDPSNLLCLCSFHHDEHHRGSFTISGDPERPDGLTFRSHHGEKITPRPPDPPPEPDLPPHLWEDNLGEHLDMRWVHFNPNHQRVPI